MDSVKSMRLNKAARDFNISMQTVVEFLAKKGYEIEAKPNTKLDPEMVEALEMEFHNDKVLKQEIAEKNKEANKKLGSLSLEDMKDESEEKQNEDFDFVEPTEAQEETVVEKEEPVAEVAEEPAAEVNEEEESVEETAEVAEEKTVQEPVAEVEEKKEEEEPAAETAEEKKEEETGGIKVVGKIDIDSINQKTRPDKKSKAQKRQEAENKKQEARKKEEEKKADAVRAEKVGAEKAAKAAEQKAVEEKAKAKAEEAKAEAAAAAESKKEDNFIKTKYEKLSGPTVVGKIDLPSEQKPKKKNGKKLVASSNDAPAGSKKAKNKRPRIDKSAKVSQGNAKDKGQGKHKGHKYVQKHEPSEEEIQKQMKETLARLQGSSKSKASKHRREKRAHIADAAKQKALDQEGENVLKVTEFLTANELASMMDVNVIEVINKCMALGLFVSINQRLDAETIQIVAEEFGYATKFVDVDEEEDVHEEEEVDNPDELVPRNPIVTVMGHVDHGKTKLLDYIRHANVVAGEAGGITQHIGAYEVELPDGRKITFLDTPGHEAFTAMRARGAKVTDIAIIVIAADDAVMPQTKEAITHAQAAGVPIVFAFNKMDKPGANADKIKEQLANMNILVEDWGGKFQSQEISAISGMGVDELLEKVLLEAEMLELKANPNKPATGTVLEASLDKGRGFVANILVQNGTLRKGDVLVAGPVYGKVKALYNERNKLIDEAGPATPALLLGLTGAPQAGDLFKVYKDEKEARAIANKRQQLLREQSLRTKKHITLDEIGRRIAIGDFKELNLIIKGDVDGSIEALSDELLKLSTEEVQVNVIHKAVGAITETDVMLASASDAIIIGFMVRPVPQARKLAEKEQVDIRTYSIIYQAKEEIEDAIKGMLTVKTEEKIVCNLEVRETFKVSKVGTVAGCYVLDGKITRNTKIRLIRDGIVIYTGNLGSLKRFKDDVKEVSAGYECGLNIENFNDIKVGDIIEGYEIVEV
jgi:translation initiation factor IF-2